MSDFSSQIDGGENSSYTTGSIKYGKSFGYGAGDSVTGNTVIVNNALGITGVIRGAVSYSNASSGNLAVSNNRVFVNLSETEEIVPNLTTWVYTSNDIARELVPGAVYGDSLGGFISAAAATGHFSAVTDNTVEISGGVVKDGQLFAAFAAPSQKSSGTYEVSRNQLRLRNTTVEKAQSVTLSGKEQFRTATLTGAQFYAVKPATTTIADNTVAITGSTIASHSINGARIGYARSGHSVQSSIDVTATGNRVTIDSSKVSLLTADQDASSINGVDSATIGGTMSGNEVVIRNGSEVVLQTHAGKYDRYLTINGSYASGVASTASNNGVVIEDSVVKTDFAVNTKDSSRLFGSYGVGNANANYVSISGQSTIQGISQIVGAYALTATGKDKYEVTGNRVEMTGSSVEVPVTAGLVSYQSGKSWIAGAIAAGTAQEFSVSENHVSLSSVAMEPGDQKTTGITIYGAYSSGAAEVAHADGNLVSIDNSSVKGSIRIYGGYAFNAKTGTASGNAISLSNSDLEKNFGIVGGAALSEVKNNVITVGPGVTSSDGSTAVMNFLYGGWFYAGAPQSVDYKTAYAGNTLNTHSRFEVGHLLYLMRYNFFLDKNNQVADKPLIKVTGTSPVVLVADPSNGTQIGVAGTFAIKTGESLVLIDSTKGFVDDKNVNWVAGADLKAMKTTVQVKSRYSALRETEQTITKDDYDLDIVDHDSGAGQDLVITRTSVDPEPDKPVAPDKPGPDIPKPPVTDVVPEDTYALTQSVLANYGSLFAASDLFVDTLLHSSDARHNGVFAAARGGRIKYETDGDIESNVATALIGISGTVGTTEIGTYIEMGHTTYETGSFGTESVETEGRNNFAGVGLFANHAVGKTALNLTAYLKVGLLRNDYDAVLAGTSYDLAETSAYWGGHLGLNYNFNLSQKIAGRAFLSYFYDAMQGSSYRFAGTKDLADSEVRFDSLQAHRVQLGTRFEYDYQLRLKPFATFAVERVFSADAGGTASDDRGDFRIASDSVEGTSGILSLGWNYRTADDGFALGLVLNGYVGARKGINGEISGVWKF